MHIQGLFKTSSQIQGLFNTVRTLSKGVTTQMKALDEYFLMVVFMLLLNRVHVFANFMFTLTRETCQ